MANSKTKMKRQDSDSPWKLILDDYFKSCLELCYPEAAAQIEWSKGYESLDKELMQVTKDAEVRAKRADKLMKVWQKDGEEIWYLIHCEIQHTVDKDFERRMFTYFYRIKDRYNKPIESIAILADDRANWCPHHYQERFGRTVLQFEFMTIKILAYQNRYTELLASSNPFAVILLAQLDAILTQKDEQLRFEKKTELTKRLYRKGLNREQILNFYTFVDWLLVLPEELALKYHREIELYEEEQKMPYITTAEKIGIQKGIEQGIQKGIQKGIHQGEALLLENLLKCKFPHISQEELNRLKYVDEEKLIEWAKRLIHAKTLVDVFKEDE